MDGPDLKRIDEACGLYRMAYALSLESPENNATKTVLAFLTQVITEEISKTRKKEINRAHT